MFHSHPESRTKQTLPNDFGISSGGTMALSHAVSAVCPLLGLRLAVYRCGLVMEKYPWQTLAALLMITASAQVCIYMGFTFLAACLLYAMTHDTV